MINLTVFCSSKNNLPLEYYSQVNSLLDLLSTEKINIVYGGGSSGLMGTIRKKWEEKSGKVIGVNMHKFQEKYFLDEYLFDNIDDRQKKLVELGDAYLVLPGGYGTHFEALEVMTKNDIGESTKPIFIFNVNGIFDGLVQHISKLLKEGFINRDFHKIKVFISDDINELSSLINEL